MVPKPGASGGEVAGGILLGHSYAVLRLLECDGVRVLKARPRARSGSGRRRA